MRRPAGQPPWSTLWLSRPPRGRRRGQPSRSACGSTARSARSPSSRAARCWTRCATTSGYRHRRCATWAIAAPAPSCVDGRAVYSCLTLAVDCDGRGVTTIEGLAHGDELDPVQQAFVEADAYQCGFCTPGQIMSVTGPARRATPRPRATDEIRRAVSGNLCRCGAYQNIVKAGQRAAELTSSADRDGSATLMSKRLRERRKCQRRRRSRTSTRNGRHQRWAAGASLSVVGKPLPRVEGDLKVTGRAAIRLRRPAAGPALRPGAAQPPPARPDHADRHLEGRGAERRARRARAARPTPDVSWFQDTVLFDQSWCATSARRSRPSRPTPRRSPRTRCA